jgi:nitroimidazol reductase NimA-like FMN-containing flavoprotein (pyridoxamine 5'-phosphate oxidase superfamily)
MTSPEASDQDLTATIESIPPTTCWNLLATTTFGRVGLLVDGKPEVLPVNYAIDGESILFRTAEDTVLTQASLTVVAFETDYVDPQDHSGWSVMVQGFARDIGDAVDPTSQRLKKLSLITWAPGTRAHWIHISPEKVTGRRIYVYPTEL